MTISVVIPARNRAGTLPACLDSILGQTRAPDEVIVVDDGSTDQTGEVIHGYADAGVTSLHLEESLGAQAARNRGVLHAQSDWIAFQDSDDIWLPTKLERQTQALEEAGFDPHTVVHTDGFRRQAHRGDRSPIRVGAFHGDCYKALLLRPGPMLQGLLASRQALVEIGMLDEACPSYHEWDTAIRLAAICNFIHIPEPLFEWVRHDDGQISADERRDMLGYQYVLEKNKAMISSQYDEHAWRRAKLDLIGRALRAHLWQDAKAMIEREPRHRSLSLAMVCATAHFAPRGIGRLLRMAAS